MAEMMIGGPKGPGAPGAKSPGAQTQQGGGPDGRGQEGLVGFSMGGQVGGQMAAPAGVQGGVGMAAGDLVKNSSSRTFMADVIDASHDVPVIVDFWAPWCGPCKTLGPQLEKAVREARGAVRMVKINIDENPDLAQQMRIQSIPVVYAFSQGRPVDGFVGAVPESQIKTFVKKLVSMGGADLPDSPIEQAMEQAKELMDAGDSANAAGILAQVIQHDPANAIAKARLSRALLAGGDTKRARQALEGIGPDKLKDPAVATEVNAAKAALDLSESASAAQGSLDELKQKIAKDANDHQARLDLATALYAAGDGDAAVDALIESIRRSRSWNEEAARKQLLKLFEAFGPTDPRTVQGRRKLSSVLFS
jgi:putative thioredoxin